MEEFEKDIKDLKNKIKEIENKYLFSKNYKVLTTLFDKLNVDRIEIDKKDIEKNNSLYLMETKEDKVIITKMEE